MRVEQWLRRAYRRSGSALPISTYDAIVYGANIGGIFYAMKMADAGKTVLVLNDYPANRLYGMMMGIMHTDVDTGNGKGVVRGLGDELYRRVAGMYSGGVGVRQESFLGGTSYGARPDFVKAALDAMLLIGNRPTNITFRHDEPILVADKVGTRIQGVRTALGDYRARMFLDSTYHGDLVNAAGVSVFVGREANATYGETQAGIRSPTNTFSTAVSPYVTPGDAGSGLLYGISNEAYGTVGDASPKVMAIAYRTWDNSTSNTLSPIPANYDASRYLLAKRNILAKGFTLFSQVVTTYLLQGSGSDVNTNGAGDAGAGQAFNYDGPETTEYVTATPARRKEIEKLIMEYQLGYLYWLRTDTDLPSAIRTSAAGLRLMNTTLWPDTPDYPGWPANLYVRQGRGMVGDAVLRQQDATVAGAVWPAVNPYEDIQVARIIYAGDRHWSRTLLVDDGAAVDGKRVVQEGGMALVTAIGNPIPAWVMWPKKSQCSNVMSTFDISASSTALGSTRMEVISQHLGQAAAALTLMILDTYPSLDVQDTLGSFSGSTYTTDPTKVAQFKQKLDYWNLYDTNGGAIVPVATSNAIMNAPVGVNGGTVTPTGTWTTANGSGNLSVFLAGRVGTVAASTMRFYPNLDTTGVYEVRLCWHASSANSRNTATIVRVVHAGGTYSTTKNQNVGTVAATDSGDWGLAGAYGTTGTSDDRRNAQIAASQFTFNSGAPSAHYVEIEVPASGGSSVISAVKFIKIS